MESIHYIENDQLCDANDINEEVDIHYVNDSDNHKYIDQIKSNLYTIDEENKLMLKPLH